MTFNFTYIKKSLKTYPDPFKILSEIYNLLILGFILGLPAIIISALDFGSPDEKDEVIFGYGPLIDFMFLIILPTNFYRL